MGIPAIFIVLALVHNAIQNPQPNQDESRARTEDTNTIDKQSKGQQHRAHSLLQCPSPPRSCTRSKYRSLDGSCNNLDNPSWGIPDTPYNRIVPYKHAEGVVDITRSESGNLLPNPREVSLRLFPDVNIVDKNFNVNAQTWGQVITHDMSHTSGARDASFVDDGECCTRTGRFVPGYDGRPFCAPVVIPEDDPIYFSIGIKCLGFSRTATTEDQDCPSRPTAVQPLTSVTAYMDLSLLYGTKYNTSKDFELRAEYGGRLLTSTRRGREWPPQAPNITICNQAKSADEPCYLAGDIRVNQNTQLAVLHVILLREHNRIADTLAELNPHWDDETLFQEARRINIAQYQHISFYEYLPIILGYDNMVKRKIIYPDATGYVDDYNPEINPSILVEHATAAFRHFHSVVRGNMQLISAKRHVIGTLRLSDWMNRPLALELKDDFDNLIRGLTTQAEGASDQYLDSEIKQYLFKANMTFGKDLRTNDIQRGRDLGLSSYVRLRAACGLSVPKTFEDMLDYISEKNVALLQALYKTHDDVELLAGGSLEAKVPGMLTGPTFLCILTEQFYRTRVADRYFYENGADSDIAFTRRQLDTIRKGASVARLLCDNSDDINEMQPRALELIKDENQLVPCDQLPAIDLSLWKETRSEFAT